MSRSNYPCQHGQTITQIDNGVTTWWCPGCQTRFGEDPHQTIDRDMVALAMSAGVLVVSVAPPTQQFGKKKRRKQHA